MLHNLHHSSPLNFVSFAMMQYSCWWRVENGALLACLRSNNFFARFDSIEWIKIPIRHDISLLLQLLFFPYNEEEFSGSWFKSLRHFAWHRHNRTGIVEIYTGGGGSSRMCGNQRSFVFRQIVVSRPRESHRFSILTFKSSQLLIHYQPASHHETPNYNV